jgi:regulator of protease activity HflC (stomatin/prohibitin superfamily)
MSASVLLFQIEFFGLGFLMFIAIALLIVAWKTIKIVPQSSVLLIERLGRFHRVAASGLNIIYPFFESPRAVYWTTCDRERPR